MTTKNTVSVLLAIFGLMQLVMWLREESGAAGWLGLILLLSFVAVGLLLYAASREKKGDRSDSVPPTVAVGILACVGLWMAFLCYRALF